MSSKYPEKMINELGVDIDNQEVRLMWYHKYGFTEDAKYDMDGSIRIGYYRKYGFTEKAIKDLDWKVRLEAYRSLGFTKEAESDEDEDIRWLASIYFSI
jgi:hypothetical protein